MDFILLRFIAFVFSAYMFSSSASDVMVPNQENRMIVGGRDATQGELPYQLSLHYNGRHICGASLIKVYGVQLAVTAAHCAQNPKPDNLTLVAGEINFKIGTGFEQTRNVKRIVIHEKYSSHNLSNDLALLFIDHFFKLNKNVNTIELPKKSQKTKGEVVISGWGSLYSGGVTPYQMQVVEIPVFNHEACKSAWEPYTDIKITEKVLCLRDPENKKSPCHGDSGGPAKSRGGYLAGVISFAHRSCSTHKFPGIFTKVSKYVRWIKFHVADYLREKHLLNNTTFYSFYHRFKETTLLLNKEQILF